MNNGHENHFSQDFTKLLFSLYKKCNILHHNCLTANNFFRIGRANSYVVPFR